MREAEAFLTALFGESVPGALRIQLWTRHNRQAHNFQTSRQAAEFAAAHRRDVYVCVSLTANPSAVGRVSADKSAAIPGVWVDLDVNGGPDGKTKRAVDLDAAVAVAKTVLEPTILVCSGYGVQAWWLFDDGPWIFEGEQERQAAAQLALDFTASVRVAAIKAGWGGLDSTHDLARLMRVPDTVNGKGSKEAPVHGYGQPVDQQDGPRYSLETLGGLARASRPTPPPDPSQPAEDAVGDITLNPEAEPPFSKFEALRLNSPSFGATWEHKRSEPWSLSEYDLSLVGQAAHAGWTDQELADLIVAHRRKYPDGSGKGQRLDYVRRTVAAVRRDSVEEEEERERTEKIDRLAAMAAQEDVDPDAAFSLFNQIIACGRVHAPRVKEIHQDSVDPKDARYRLVLESGVNVPIGKISAVLSPDQFREAFAVVTGHVIKGIKRDKWLGGIQTILDVRILTAPVDESREGRLLEWLTQYAHERLGHDVTEAARRREPFQKDGNVFVRVDRLAQFVRDNLRFPISEPDTRDMLKTAGFERKTITYEVEPGKTTSRSYYYAPLEILR